MPHQFVHLHTHSEFSLLDGMSRITDLVKRTRELGMKSLALTDHGNMYAAVKFYVAAREHEVHPLLGCEMYLAPRTRLDKETKEDRSPYHLTVLAKDNEGYRNLLKLVSLASLEGFYMKPRIDKELIEKYHKGLVILSGCPAGEIPSLVLASESAKARQLAKFYKELLGEDFYLEVQDLGMPEQKIITKELIEIGRELKIKLVATNDSHYVNREDAFGQDVLLCIGTGSTLDDAKRLHFDTQEFYLKSSAEMMKLFKGCEEAVLNTLEVAEKCRVDLKLGETHLPNFPVPGGELPDSYLEKLVWEGIRRKYGKEVDGKLLVPPEINDRVKYELYTIEKMGYAPYFLIVQDFINYAKSQGIQVGPGRGSAAGSIVSYSLGITNVDPIKQGLIFERFLNLERITLPDIDIDFCFKRRQEVIDYVTKKYGGDRVAQIVTFGTMAARGSVRDVGRVQNIPLVEVDRIAKMIPFGPDITIEKGLEMNKELKKLYEGDAKVKALLDTAQKIEGLSRHASVHAAGVVISDLPLTEYVPLQKLDENVNVTQYQMTDLEKIGLLKMDFLGLRNLTMIAQAVQILKHTRGIEIDINDLPFDDQKTYSLLRSGETMGIFQLESRGMRGLIKELQPDNFGEIVALLALYRPGPLESGMVEDFVKRKHKKVEVRYDLPELQPILRETFGVILYQEQVMEIASTLAGFTLGQADVLRAAMGKKKKKEMAEQKERFIAGAEKRGISHNKAAELFNICDKFAGYGFNKSHSTSYAVISFQTAYLKANYPVEFMAALLTSVMGNTDKVTAYIAESQRMGIKVLPPDVNQSFRNFTVTPEGIRFGLTAVKNVGEGAIDTVLAARKSGGTFRSLADLCSRIDTRACNKKVIESLIKAGAFDSVSRSRAQLLASYEKTLGRASSLQKEVASGQVFLFDMQPEAAAPQMEAEETAEVVELSPQDLLKMEKEMLGLYISHHPLEHLKDSLAGSVKMTVADALEKYEGDAVRLGGLLANCRKINTRRGDLMLLADLEDLTGTIPLVVFPKAYEKFTSHLIEDAVLVVQGRLNRDARTEELNLVAENVEPLSEMEKVRSLHVEVVDVKDKKILEKLKEILLFYKGEDPVLIYYDGRKIAASDKYHVDISTDLVSRIEELLGTGSARVEFNYIKKGGSNGA